MRLNKKIYYFEATVDKSWQLNDLKIRQMR